VGRFVQLLGAALGFEAWRSPRTFRPAFDLLTVVPIEMGDGARDPRSVVRSRVRGSSLIRRRALRAPRFPVVFPGLGRGVVERRLRGSPPARWNADAPLHTRPYPLRRNPPSTDGVSGLSSIPNSPVLWAGVPFTWTRRFHSPPATPTDRVLHLSSFRTSSKAPVCETGSIVRRVKRGRIESHKFCASERAAPAARAWRSRAFPCGAMTKRAFGAWAGRAPRAPIWGIERASIHQFDQ